MFISVACVNLLNMSGYNLLNLRQHDLLLHYLFLAVLDWVTSPTVSTPMLATLHTTQTLPLCS